MCSVTAIPPHRRLVVPDHRVIAKGTLRALIRDAGLTTDEFVSLHIARAAQPLSAPPLSTGKGVP